MAKKYSINIVFLALLISLIGCGDTYNKEFVYLNDKDFEIKGEKFFPILMNYLVDLREIEGELVMGPTIEYDKSREFICDEIDCLEDRIDSHFKLIKKMGFNTIRLCGFSGPMKGSEYFVFPLYKESKASPFDLSEENIKLFIQALNGLVDIAERNDLKVMLLFPRPTTNLDHNALRKNYIINVLKSFKEKSTVFAYDFFNEPLYFDNEELPKSKRERTKKEAYDLVNNWKSLMQKYAPKQLLTVSFAEPIEVFEWDPSVLPVDFVSIHTYHPLRVPNEIYWFSKYIHKPILITETSLPSDNDSISYNTQALFIKETLQRAIDCEISGFGWWQFQDVNWGPYAQNSAGLISRYKKITKFMGEDVYGEVKPAAQITANFKVKKKNDCNCLSNYYNMLGYYNYRVTGKIVEKKTNRPIEGAVIRGWNKGWTRGQNTFTDSNGVFHLYSNDAVAHIKISAPGMELIRIHKKMDYKEVEKSIFNSNKVNLHYKDIHFQSFVKNENLDSSVLDFDPELFTKFAFDAQLNTIGLKKVNF